MIGKIVNPFIAPLKRKVLMPLKKAKNWPKLLAKWIKRKMKEILGQKEITKASYVPLGNYYISKKLIVIIILVVLVLYFFLFIKPPKFINKWFNRTPSITMAASAPAPDHNGIAKVYDEQKRLIYHGNLKNGLYDGDGKQYEANGLMRYQGSFSAGKYEGQGSLYSGDGDNALLYEGKFAAGQYEGKGKRFRADGSLVEEGTFATGELAQGKRYDEDGQLIYEGALAGGLYHGQGASYDATGTLRYQGAFVGGLPGGQGRSYTEQGRLIYEGGYENGLYAGSGTLYDEQGRMLYQGEFLSGDYYGAGKSFYSDGKVQYEGAFINGQPSGTGTAYFEDGHILYNGDFLSGKYHGSGTLYDEAGNTIYSGGIRQAEYHGEGELYSEDGLLEYKGTFKQGRLNGIATWLKDGVTLLYRGEYQNGYLAPQGYLNLSPEQLEGLLEKPSITESEFSEPPPASLEETLQEEGTGNGTDPQTDGTEAIPSPSTETEMKPDETTPQQQAQSSSQEVQISSAGGGSSAILEDSDGAVRSNGSEPESEMDKTEQPAKDLAPGDEPVLLSMKMKYPAIGMTFTAAPDSPEADGVVIQQIEWTAGVLLDRLYLNLEELSAKEESPVIRSVAGSRHYYYWDGTEFVIVVDRMDKARSGKLTPIEM